MPQSHESRQSKPQRRQQAAAGQCSLQVIGCGIRLPTLLKGFAKEHSKTDGAARLCVSVQQNVLQQAKVLDMRWGSWLRSTTETVPLLQAIVPK